MSSTILSSLPTIHVTIIGIVAACLSAFVIFAYQKLDESKEKLDRALRDASELSKQNRTFCFTSTQFLSEEGLLDWDGIVKKTFRDAATMGRGTASPSTVEGYDEFVCKLGNELFSFLHLVFTTYPFIGKSTNMLVDDHQQEANKKRDLPFNFKRLEEMNRRIRFLSYIWRIDQNSILKFVSHYSELKYKEERERWEKTCDNLRSRLSEMPGVYNNFMKDFHVNKTDYGEVIDSFFKLVKYHESMVLPLLVDVITQHERYQKKFKIKKISLWVVRAIIFILISGVCIPLIVMEMLSGATYFNWHSFWFSSFEYFLLLVTLAPYFVACWYFYREIHKWSFE
ncbi:hypothetical protein [Vibrio parahaemolyticus]|uniref:hypothetical protein n=1 Tax=Vibrio parahaemolyticus TaxID=670 RepID=UPI001F15AAFB|nr:hypothetical protein [Vibrio parahaemolyticus]MCG0011816.1 hypothetical protein [Vibrio parahaemolyticus]MDL1997232.1 hypothetical protein [Vibrio parahaemolyticus]